MSNNFLVDGIKDIGSSSGSYHTPSGSFSAFPDPGLQLGDVFLIIMSGVILFKTFGDYSKNKSASVSSLPSNK